MPERFPNPYDFRNACISANDDSRPLSARDDEITDIKYSLSDFADGGHASHMSLIGERAAGKTSLLNHIENSLCPELGLLPVKLTLTDDDGSSEMRFFGKLIEMAARAAFDLGAWAPPTPETPHTTQRNYDELFTVFTGPKDEDDNLFWPLIFPIHWQKAAEQDKWNTPVSEATVKRDIELLYKETGKKIVFLIDESQRISNQSIFQKLRNELLDNDSAVFILAGTVTLSENISTAFSLVTRQFQTVKVEPYLGYQGTRACLLDPLEKASARLKNDKYLDAFAEFDDKEFIEIHELTGGRPYEISLVGAFMFENMRKKDRIFMTLDLAVLDDVQDEIAKSAQPNSAPAINAIRSLTESQLKKMAMVASACEETPTEVIDSINHIFSTDNSVDVQPVEQIVAELSHTNLLQIEDGRVKFTETADVQVYLRYFAKARKISLEVIKSDLPEYFIRSLGHSGPQLGFSLSSSMRLSLDLNVDQQLFDYTIRSNGWIDYRRSDGPSRSVPTYAAFSNIVRFTKQEATGKSFVERYFICTLSTETSEYRFLVHPREWQWFIYSHNLTSDHPFPVPDSENLKDALSKLAERAEQVGWKLTYNYVEDQLPSLEELATIMQTAYDSGKNRRVPKFVSEQMGNQLAGEYVDGKSDAAAEYLKPLNELAEFTSPEVKNNAGYLMMHRQDYHQSIKSLSVSIEKAQEEAKRIAEKKPSKIRDEDLEQNLRDQVLYHYNLGIAKLMTNDVDSAIQSWQSAESIASRVKDSETLTVSCVFKIKTASGANFELEEVWKDDETGYEPNSAEFAKHALEFVNTHNKN
jgi:hypothetical protein